MKNKMIYLLCAALLFLTMVFAALFFEERRQHDGTKDMLKDSIQEQLENERRI